MPGEGLHVNRAPEELHKGITATPASFTGGLHANTYSMRNKQELEMCTSARYDFTGIADTWCDGSDDWSVGMDGCSPFRKHRQGRRGAGVTLYINDQLECVELCLGMDELAKNLWLRFTRRAGTGDITVGVG